MGTAALILACILPDLADAGCDPIQLPSASSIVTSLDDGAADACQDVCVADCYCCSATLPALEAFSLDEPKLVTENLPAPPSELPVDRATGVDHIPLASL